MPQYRVLMPELADKLGIGAMDLVRDCRIAVGTAYAALRRDINLDTCWKIFVGLLKAGYTVDGRPVKFSDIVDFSEFGPQ